MSHRPGPCSATSPSPLAASSLILWPPSQVLLGNLGINFGDEIYEFLRVLRESHAPLRVLDVHSNPLCVSGSPSAHTNLSAIREVRARVRIAEEIHHSRCIVDPSCTWR